jgi:hypothetical protein
VIETVLVRQHYPAGEETAGGSFKAFSFFPDEILLEHPLKNAAKLKKTVKAARTKAEWNCSPEIKRSDSMWQNVVLAKRLI